MTGVEAIVVVVPVNDEELLLEACLAAIEEARADFAERTPVRVIVVLDACTDASAQIAARHPVEVVVVDLRTVGAARAAGVERAIRTHRGPSDALWIANTDADSRVPPTWLHRQHELALAGADLVVGSIHPDPADLTAEQFAAWQRRAAAERASGEPHTHVYGANIGIRASVYEGVGGFSALEVGEDIDLVRRATARGACAVFDLEAAVRTSARTVGRTPGGYSEYVRVNY